jgi:hypothetical protein
MDQADLLETISEELTYLYEGLFLDAYYKKFSDEQLDIILKFVIWGKKKLKEQKHTIRSIDHLSFAQRKIRDMRQQSAVYNIEQNLEKLSEDDIKLLEQIEARYVNREDIDRRNKWRDENKKELIKEIEEFKKFSENN